MFVVFLLFCLAVRIERTLDTPKAAWLFVELVGFSHSSMISFQRWLQRDYFQPPTTGPTIGRRSEKPEWRGRFLMIKVFFCIREDSPLNAELFPWCSDKKGSLSLGKWLFSGRKNGVPHTQPPPLSLSLFHPSQQFLWEIPIKRQMWLLPMLLPRY